MNNYCVDLNFNCPVITQNFNVLKYKGIPHSAVSPDIFEPRFINLLKSLGLKVTWSEIFYIPKREERTYGIHTDNAGGDYVKMNWIFGGENSLMQWYTINPGIHKEPIKTAINSLYISFNNSEVTLAHAQMVKFPSIVQVGSPHNIYNPTEDRFCLSIMLRDSDNNRLTMDRAKQLFSPYITL
jgi:hypothetical protein